MIPTSTFAIPQGDCWSMIGISGDQSCPELVQFTHCRNCPVFASAARVFFDRPAPEGYLDEWSQRLGGPQALSSTDASSVSLVIFRLEEEWLALNTKAVAEVTAVRPTHHIPHRTNQILTGLVNLRGQLYLCASLHGLLGVDRSPSEGHGQTPRMIIIRQGSESWVFPAEEVVGVHAIPRDELRAVPSTLANPTVSFTQAVFTWNGFSVGHLDEQRIFSGLRSLGQ